uniref:Putative secreted protein n=1 Tax=Anopheles darlingi TaxID=43151 RepID=A0A2M4D768_ANODA
MLMIVMVLLCSGLLREGTTEASFSQMISCKSGEGEGHGQPPARLSTTYYASPRKGGTIMLSLSHSHALPIHVATKTITFARAAKHGTALALADLNVCVARCLSNRLLRK